MTTDKHDTRPPVRAEGPAETMDWRMVCRMRLVLAVSALVVTYLDPSEPARLVAVTYGALVLYTAYGGLLYLLARRRGAGPPSRAAHWVDTGCYLLLVALSSGTGSVFFFFFFFSILVASFHWGFAEGLRVAVVSAALFTAVGYLSAPGGTSFELNRFLLRPVYLLVLGYMIAYWGGFELELKRRLALLRDVNAISNPRFGVGHTIASIMRRVRAFYEADACLLVLTDAEGGPARLSRVARGGRGEEEAHGEPLPEGLAAQFLSLPERAAVVYHARGPWWWRPPRGRYYACDLLTNEEERGGREAAERVAVLLDSDSFISAPVLYGGRSAGRAYLTNCRRADVAFLAQIMEHVIPVLNNVRLLDRLASSAAEQERQKIARDIHDSVIQPYIGLQYKVAAIRNKLARGGADVAADLEHLCEVTAGEVTGLRRYVRGLKEAGASRDDLLSAVGRYVRQFEDNYGITVGVEAAPDLRVNDRLAAELIQMVHEGLSNVRKHTEATRCSVAFATRDGRLVLSVENDGAAPPFVPRSITERAENLGGRARVETTPDGRTAVRVEIPL